MFVKRADKVVFVDDSIEEEFNALPEEDWLKKALRVALKNLKQNAFCGERIPKYLIPKVYIQKYGIDNLWWYALPNWWRLVYSVMAPSNIEILAVIIEYFDHKNYERRFHY